MTDRLRRAAFAAAVVVPTFLPRPGAALPPDRETLEAYHRLHEGHDDLEENSPKNPQELRLGRDLFFDKRLSRGGVMSCATCHRPDKAWSDGRPRAVGRDGRTLARKAPSLYILRRNHPRNFFWDGRAATLEDAVLTALKNPAEMDGRPEEIQAYLAASPDYARRFHEIYGKPPTTDAAVVAVGRFIKDGIPLPLTPFDRFEAAPDALDAGARRGMILFAGKAACFRCHFGPYLSDDYYHNTGLRPAPGEPEDPGRYAVIPDPANWGAFKTPPLRNVALTAPYMHDGSLKTLADVVEFYDRGGDMSEGRDAAMQPLRLSAGEKSDLVAFLEALSAPADSGYPARAGAARGTRAP
jgi:cytochrome c peroxidase